MLEGSRAVNASGWVMAAGLGRLLCNGRGRRTEITHRRQVTLAPTLRSTGAQGERSAGHGHVEFYLQLEGGAGALPPAPLPQWIAGPRGLKTLGGLQERSAFCTNRRHRRASRGEVRALMDGWRQPQLMIFPTRRGTRNASARPKSNRRALERAVSLSGVAVTAGRTFIAAERNGRR